MKWAVSSPSASGVMVRNFGHWFIVFIPCAFAVCLLVLQEVRLYKDDLVLWEQAGSKRKWTAVGNRSKLSATEMLGGFTQELGINA